MASDKNNKEKEVIERRKILQAELQEIESKLDTSVGRLKSEVEEKVAQTRDKLSPAYWIKRYPHFAMGGAVALGFILAPSSRKKNQQEDDYEDSYEPRRYEDEYRPRRRSREVYNPPAGRLILAELKRMLLQKATTYLVNKVEDTIDLNISRHKNKGEKQDF